MSIRSFRSTDRDAVERLLTIALATPTTSADAPPIEVGLNTALLGDPAYSGRFGFVPGAELGILAPEPAWGEYFPALRLAAAGDAHRGGFRYARPFEEL
ncbi:hypothetical protein BJY17_002603 [Agromyces hippuratus]|uniref:Uncharacterized protein n=1 Tax=Agromyces hippuratus TaxID=286438 RepID=A0A852WUZ5_9MICO|nr:hypothetical protein [Agromyces hippuratus]NYG21856.1 hypothetical protein [Agromyces hippuratus]